MNKYLYLIGLGVALSSCTNESVKYESKESEASALIKNCSHNPNIDFTKLDNTYQLTNTYLNNCNPKTSPSTAIYIGINPYYN